jgi:predicted nuclease of predicted toxin-antitoxin system
MRFLADECISPALVAEANAAGYEAYHVAHRGWSAYKDAQLFALMLSENLAFVTNNRDDFLGLVRGAELHPGLVVILENAPRAVEIRCFRAALQTIATLGTMLNRVVEVDVDSVVTVFD